MSIDISDVPATALAEYARVPIAFQAESIIDVTARPDGGFILTERQLDSPYSKDYDAIGGEGPMRWGEQFDLSNWGFFAARREGRIIGGAAVAFRTEGIIMLEGRDDLAVLWDIRVAPEARGQGVGEALFDAVELWARARGCRRLKVETQNINPAACRFYARRGCTLGAVDHHAYPDLPGEVQLLWYKELNP